VRSIYQVHSNQVLEIASSKGPGLPRPKSFHADQTEDTVYTKLSRLSKEEEGAYARGPVPAEVKPYLESLMKKGAQFDLGRDGKIRSVLIMGDKFKDSDLKQLPTLRGITSMAFMGVNISDDGLEHVAKLEQLERLRLDATDVTDAGVTKLKSLKHLQELSLSISRVSDASIKTLGEMKWLKELDLTQTLVSKQGLLELRKLLPDCKVSN
jgi:hypothetical protein